MCKNLWPKIDTAKQENPKSVLQQQADFLYESSDHIIKGYVETSDGSNYESETDLLNLFEKKDNRLCHRLYITVPSMGDVRFLIVSLLQNAFETFPCTLKDEVNEIEYKDIKDIDGFISTLERILQSSKISNLLANLVG